ncbi:hypothetical protein [Arthrobacter sp. SX1312]|uniref:hypothetical protein n=1 Tax=Arthrobacter sp. SX1312 TaxID=2058896 RepID=UPI000CE35610|nr:hypothetical protein [Arthrobacter sp. SX1312]
MPAPVQITERLAAAGKALQAASPAGAPPYKGYEPRWAARASAAVEAADTSDAARGIRRVRADETAIECVARAINQDGAYCGNCDWESGWDACTGCQEVTTRYARSALAVLTGDAR